MSPTCIAVFAAKPFASAEACLPYPETSLDRSIAGGAGEEPLIDVGRGSFVTCGGDVLCLFISFNAKGWRSQGRVRFHQRLCFTLQR